MIEQRAKYKKGQCVKINGSDAVFRISHSGINPAFNIATYTFEYRLDGLTGHYKEHDLSSLKPKCPVCRKPVDVSNNKITEHNHNNQLCYGSYMPCLE